MPTRTLEDIKSISNHGEIWYVHAKRDRRLFCWRVLKRKDRLEISPDRKKRLLQVGFDGVNVGDLIIRINGEGEYQILNSNEPLIKKD